MKKKQPIMQTTITVLAAIEYLKRLEKQIMHHYNYLENCVDYEKLPAYPDTNDTIDSCIHMVAGQLLELDIHSTRARKRLEKLAKSEMTDLEFAQRVHEVGKEMEELHNS
jgi:hypothetical protein